MWNVQNVLTAGTVTTVPTSVTVPDSRATRRLDSASVERERPEKTAVRVGSSTSACHSVRPTVSRFALIPVIWREGVEKGKEQYRRVVSCSDRIVVVFVI